MSELEAAFGAAVKSMGPKFVLDIVPLKLGENRGGLDFPQSWILPVLKNNVCKTELAFYTSDLLPLAGKMRSLGQEWRTKGRDLEGKLFETLECQIWSLLPSFCKQCTDITDSFSPIAKLFGTALNERPDIRPIICQSIMHLVEESQNNEMDRSVIAKFSKNFLPILFNLYTTKQSTEASQDHVLLCIKSYLSITEEKLLNSLFSKLVSKLTDQKSSDMRTRSALEDITEAFVPFISRNDLSNLFETISPILDSGNLTDQKKCYKLLNSMLSHQSLEHSAFVEANLTRLQELLLGSLSTAGTGSKKRVCFMKPNFHSFCSTTLENKHLSKRKHPRLRCLLQIVSRIGPESADFISAVVPEVILCTKESNEKCRNIAYQLLKGLGYASQRCYETTPEESVRKYFSVVLAGLAGSTHMVSATVGAMARLVYEFNDLLGSQLISKLLSSVCIFFSAKSKEVVRSTLIFVKVVIGVLSPSELAPHVEELVTKILKWNENHKSHFRMKSRYILEKLTQKFSYEMIGEHVPQKHKQLMAHIKKMAERKKRQQKDKQQDSPKGDDEDCVRVQRKSVKPSFEKLLHDSDDESDITPLTNKTSRFKGDDTWLREGEGDEPLDFMDPSVTKRIIGTKPSKNNVEDTADSFKIGRDGKMIIVDDDDILMEQSTDGEDEEMMAEMELDEQNTDSKRGRKRTFSRAMETNQQATDKRSLNLSGGSGIFRKNPRKTAPEEHGSEYRAKKAKGDMKKHGKPDPYAYIQLDRQKLNRRKRAKLSGQFSSILSKAKKGAAKGSKQKRL